MLLGTIRLSVKLCKLFPQSKYLKCYFITDGHIPVRILEMKILKYAIRDIKINIHITKRMNPENTHFRRKM